MITIKEAIKYVLTPISHKDYLWPTTRYSKTSIPYNIGTFIADSGNSEFLAPLVSATDPGFYSFSENRRYVFPFYSIYALTSRSQSIANSISNGMIISSKNGDQRHRVILVEKSNIKFFVGDCIIAREDGTPLVLILANYKAERGDLEDKNSVVHYKRSSFILKVNSKVFLDASNALNKVIIKDFIPSFLELGTPELPVKVECDCGIEDLIAKKGIPSIEEIDSDTINKYFATNFSETDVRNYGHFRLF